MLDVSSLNVHYGQMQAVTDLSISVKEGQVVAVTGSNGSGKTSALNAIAGIISPSSGSITFRSEEIAGFPAHHVVKRGIVQVPEGRQLFSTLSVRENLLAGLHSSGGFLLQKKIPEHLLDRFPMIGNRLDTTGAGLSGGQAQMLALARGLIARPRLLLLDEPTLGLAPIAVREIFGLIVRLREEGQTILIVEQNVRQTLEISDYSYVLESGRIVMEGTGGELLKDSRLADSYLGQVRPG